jgi:nucleoside-diphosphate-sugar epimerase
LKVLLTGDRGYIGRVMTKYLLARGHQVTGLDTDYYYDCDFGQAPAAYPIIDRDIRNVDPDDLQGFDAIVHLAGLSNDPLGSLQSDLTYDINYHASIRLAKLAKQVGIRRFLFASSCSMYGAAGDKVLDEEATLSPLTPYAESKVRTEEGLSALADEHFSPTHLRNATAYGVSSRLRIDIVLNNLVGWSVTTGKIQIMSDGTPWRPIVHIEDISQAFALALEAPLELVHNQAFNIGADSENYQVRDLAAIVQKVVPNSEVEYAGQAGPDPRNYRVDFGKFKKAFPAYQPRWSALKGAQELYEAYRTESLAVEGMTGKKYVRLKQIETLLSSGELDTALRWRENGQARSA